MGCTSSDHSNLNKRVDTNDNSPSTLNKHDAPKSVTSKEQRKPPPSVLSYQSLVEQSTKMDVDSEASSVLGPDKHLQVNKGEKQRMISGEFSKLMKEERGETEKYESIQMAFGHYFSKQNDEGERIFNLCILFVCFRYG